MEMTTKTDGYLLIERKGNEYELSVKDLGIFDVIEALGHCASAMAHAGKFEQDNVVEAIGTIAKIEE